MPAASAREPRVGPVLEPSSEPSEAPAVHFPGLNGVRFFAAFAVLLYHVEVFKHFSRLPSGVAHPFWRVLGPQGVTAFFTLSGFLVTYLLLEEIRRTGSIGVRKFYARRVLRIWPLYYLVMLLGFGAAFVFAERLGFPHAVHQPLAPQLALFALLLPNLAWVSYGNLPFASPLWSVGVEEQFYLSWAPLLRSFARHVLALLLATIVLLVTARLVLPWIALWLQSGPESAHLWTIGRSFFDTLKLECMAIGGLAAYLFHVRAERPLAFLYHPATQLGALLFIPVALFFGLDAHAFDNVVWGSAYAVLILNVATNPARLVSLEHPRLDALGRISYGIYLYHSFAVAGVLLVLLWLKKQGQIDPSPLVFNGVLYALSIVLTLAVAEFSYRFYEKRFLLLKRRFTVVSSRADADPAQDAPSKISPPFSVERSRAGVSRVRGSLRAQGHGSAAGTAGKPSPS